MTSFDVADPETAERKDSARPDVGILSLPSGEYRIRTRDSCVQGKRVPNYANPPS
jgi:hypothetical protein